MFNLSSLLRIVAFITVTMVSTVSYGANDLDDFELGKEAFKSKLYQQALDYFESSKGVGVNTISLSYNIAVTHYKLGNYEQSRIYFNEIRDNPKMTSLVDYNLGLIELKVSNKQAAIILFEAVYKNTDMNKLKSLAKIQLNKLRSRNKSKSKSRIKFRASLSRAYTDNVTTIATVTASGEADSFMILTASIDAALSNSFKRGLTAKVGYFNQDLNKFDRYDFDETELNIKYNYIVGHYRNYFSLYSKSSTLNSLPYQTKTGFEARLRNRINKKSSLNYRFRYENIKEDDLAYLYLAGTKQQFRVDYKRTVNTHYNRFRYQFETNDRNDTTTRSYSPERHVFRYSYGFKFFNNWRSKTDFEYRRSDYPQVATQNRQDDRFRARTAVSYKISGNLNIQGRFEYRDNKSTDVDYVYKRKLYYLDLNFRI